MRWPDFFIAGAPKCGSTSLYHRLRLSPDVFMPDLKEPRYFLTSIDRSTFFVPCVLEESAYLDLFSPGLKAPAIGEATPSYIMDPAAAAGIAAKNPAARLVFILRDPVERAHSAFHFHETRHATGRSLAEAIDRSLRAEGISDMHTSYLLEPGFYARHLDAWSSHFPASQMLVLIFEEVIADDVGTLERVCEFLGVTLPDLEQQTNAQRNVALEPRNGVAGRVLSSPVLKRAAGRVLTPKVAKRFAESVLMKPFKKSQMEASCRETLEALYRDDVLALEQRLGRELPWFHRRPGASRAE